MFSENSIPRTSNSELRGNLINGENKILSDGGDAGRCF